MAPTLLEEILANNNLPVVFKLLKTLDPKTLRAISDSSRYLRNALAKHDLFWTKTVILKDVCTLNWRDRTILKLVYPVVLWMAGKANQKEFYHIMEAMRDFAQPYQWWIGTWEYSEVISWAEGKEANCPKIEQFTRMDLSKLPLTRYNSTGQTMKVEEVEGYLRCLPEDEKRPWLPGQKHVPWDSLPCSLNPARPSSFGDGHRCYTQYGPCHDSTIRAANKNYSPAIPLQTLQHLLAAHVKTQDSWDYSRLLVFLETSPFIPLVKKYVYGGKRKHMLERTQSKRFKTKLTYNSDPHTNKM